MKRIAIAIIGLLSFIISMAQDSLQMVSLTPIDTIHSSKYGNDSLSQGCVELSKIENLRMDINELAKKFSNLDAKFNVYTQIVPLDVILSQDSIMLSKIEKLGMDINKLTRLISNLDAKSNLSTQVVPVDVVLSKDSIMLSKIEEVGMDLNQLNRSFLESVEINNTKLDYLLVVLRILMIILIILVILVVLMSIYYIRNKNNFCSEITSVPNENSLDQEITKESESIEEPLLPLTETEIVIYNDAIQAFVNINEYIYELKRHNSLITPYILWFASDNIEQPYVDFSSISEDDRSKVALLVSKITQFKQNYLQAINHYLIRAQKKVTYIDCVRCPLNGYFNIELDQHLLGEDFENGDEIRSVYKLGFLFPNSKTYPYREKSLII